MKKNILPVATASLFITFLCISVAPAWGSRSGDYATIVLPAPIILSSLQKAMPIPVRPDNETIDGTIVIASIDSLQIENNRIHITGVIQGQNLSLVSKISNQNIRLKLGQVTLPVTCALDTRFDKEKNSLHIRPDFQSQGSSSLTPLFNALQKKEYMVPLKDLQFLDINLGETSLPLKVSAVDMIGRNNELILKFEPAM